jgi:hypothetical protein
MLTPIVNDKDLICRILLPGQRMKRRDEFFRTVARTNGNRYGWKGSIRWFQGNGLLKICTIGIYSFRFQKITIARDTSPTNGISSVFK